MRRPKPVPVPGACWAVLPPEGVGCRRDLRPETLLLGAELRITDFPTQSAPSVMANHLDAWNLGVVLYSWGLGPCPSWDWTSGSCSSGSRVGNTMFPLDPSLEMEKSL